MFGEKRFNVTKMIRLHVPEPFVIAWIVRFIGERLAEVFHVWNQSARRYPADGAVVVVTHGKENRHCQAPEMVFAGGGL